ncbi:MAG: outer membrane lipid asymmetry maintenance protein MlaD [Gammaproteobacteria bacterium]
MPDNKLKIETITGTFMLIGLLCMGYLAIKMGDVGLLGDDTYQLQARFTSVSGLKKGSYIEAAGVRIGKIRKIEFDPEYYLAIVTMDIDKNVKVPEDATASVRTAGIIGDKFIKIAPGGAENYLEPGMEIQETEPSINLEELISKYIFE